jgi:hypothetical protein
MIPSEVGRTLVAAREVLLGVGTCSFVKSLGSTNDSPPIPTGQHANPKLPRPIKRVNGQGNDWIRMVLGCRAHIEVETDYPKVEGEGWTGN